MTSNINALLDRFEDVNVLVIGDAMLDVYLRGSSTRICREAPVPIVNVAERETRPGGAGNAAAAVAGLGASVVLVSAVGDDAEGTELVGALEAANVRVDSLLRIADHSTLAKERVIADDHLLVRFDQGTGIFMRRGHRDRLIAAIERHWDWADVIIVSDYGYGVMDQETKGVLQRLRQREERPIVVDSPDPGAFKDLRPTVVKPSFAQAAQMLGPGHVKRRTGPTKAWFALGELHGRVTPRVQELAAILGAAGKTEVTSNIWGAKWSKLIVNTMSHAIAAILRGTDSDVAENPKLLELGTALGRECLDVGSALGYRVEPIFGLTAQDMMGAPDAMLQRILITLCTHIGKHTNSFLQDMLKDRPPEVHYMNGLVAAKGREAGVPTPLNDEITQMVEQIESGEMSFGPEQLPRLESLVSSRHATDYPRQ